jgi:cytoskeletal protein CcmA (bactofilin family)
MTREMFNRPHARAALFAILATFVLAGPAAAGDFRSDTTVTIGADETVDDDLYIGGGTVSIAGTVNGDATIGAGTVTMTGTVNGSLNVAGGTVDVLGDVTGAVRVSGGTVRIVGSVGRDVVIFGGTATIEAGAEIEGDVAGATGSLTVAGTVHGNLRAGTGTMVLAGTVDGEVEAGVGDLSIESGAVIGGDVTYTSANEARIADGAQIGGDVVRREPAAEAESVVADNPIVSYLGLLLGLLLLGWGMLAIRPRLLAGSAETLRTSPLPSLGLGAAGCLGQFVLVILLIVVGALLGALAGALGGGFIGAAIVVVLLIVLLLILSAVPVAMAIGRLVLPGDRSGYLVYLAGAAILALALVVGGFVPALGGLVFLVVWVLGLGAFILYAWRTRREPFVLPPPPAPPEAASSPAA